MEPGISIGSRSQFVRSAVPNDGFATTIQQSPVKILNGVSWVRMITQSLQIGTRLTGNIVFYEHPQWFAVESELCCLFASQYFGKGCAEISPWRWPLSRHTNS